MKARLPEEYTAKGANQMMKQAQQMQLQMNAIQQELREKEYEASSGGSMVTARVSGEYELLSLDIKPEVVNPDDVEMLCDLVTAAVNSAVAEAKTDYQNEMGKLTGGMDLSGLI